MIVVTGANGHLGRGVVHHLLATLPATEIAVSVRDPHKATELTKAGVSVRQGDFDTPETLPAAFAGAKRLLLVSADGPVSVRIGQHRNAVDAAKRAGVPHVFYTSVLDPDPASPFTFAAIHADTEAYLRDSGLEYTFLRNGIYTEGLISSVQAAAASGALAAPAAGSKVAYVARQDLAEATARVLTQEGQAGKVYDLTGAQAVDHAQIAALVSHFVGRDIVYQSLEPEAYTAQLTELDLPLFLAEAISSLFAAMRQNRFEAFSPHLADILGRSPLSIGDILEPALATRQ